MNKNLISILSVAAIVVAAFLYIKYAFEETGPPPSDKARENFAKLNPEQKARWAIGIPGMSKAMRYRQIDAIEGATESQKAEWKRKVDEKYKGYSFGGPDYDRGGTPPKQ